MAMSRAMVEKFVAGFADGSVRCSAPDTFDDMQVGKWFTRYLKQKVLTVHEDGFHQSAPENFHPYRLAHEELLSFHKFKMQLGEKDKSFMAKKLDRLRDWWAEFLGIVNSTLDQAQPWRRARIATAAAVSARAWGVAATAPATHRRAIRTRRSPRS